MYGVALSIHRVLRFHGGGGVHLHLDFETRSGADLPKCGVDIYASHPTTDIMCMAYSYDEMSVNLWTPDKPFPIDVARWVGDGKPVIAHNAAFEILVWNGVLHRYGVKQIFQPEQAICTMAMSYAMALPGSLENAAAATGIQSQKDLKGSRIMLQLSKPREISADGTPIFYTPTDSPEKFERLYEYCKQDVRVERELFKRLLPLSPFERKVWLMDFAINRRGIYFDRPLAEKALSIVESEGARLDKKMKEVTGNGVATCSAVGQLSDWLRYKGVDSHEGVGKTEVARYLELPNLPRDVREALLLRQEAAKTSTKKFAAMMNSASEDNRMRGLFQYCGAGATWRFAGRRVQLQNFPRPTHTPSDIAYAFEILNGDNPRDMLEMVYGKPLSILASSLRGFLIAPPGKKLVASDESSIEARVIAWLAGEEVKLEIFRSHGKIYEYAAALIYRVAIQSILKDDPRRQVGKISELALGFQGGVKALQSMAEAYGIKLAPLLAGLLEAATVNNRVKAENNWARDKSKSLFTREEYLASDLVKLAWREANPNIVKFWYDLEEASIEAVLNPGAKFSAGAVGRECVFKKSGSFLFCKLPSNHVICYPYPKVEEFTTPWGAVKRGMTYKAVTSQTNKWETQKSYGGLLAENCTQSLARDVLVDSWEELEAKGYKIVLHAHDENVAECDDKSDFNEEDMSKIMTKPKPWSRGLPLEASGYESKRYRK